MCLAWSQINLRDDTDEIQDYLKELTGGRSVPRVMAIAITLAGTSCSRHAPAHFTYLLY